MATLDVRKDTAELVTRIVFDNSDGGLINRKGQLSIKYSRDEYILCNMSDIDNFILAAQKAKELWRNK